MGKSELALVVGLVAAGNKSTGLRRRMELKAQQ